MDWRRVKTIMILFMLAVNLALLLLWGTRLYAADSARAQAQDYLLALLRAQGLHAAPGVLPDETVTAPTLEIPRDSRLEQALVEALFGPASLENTGGNRIAYQAQTGQASFDTGGDLVLLPKVSFPFDKEHDALAAASALLRQWGDQTEPVLRDWGVLVRQRIGGLPVWNGELSLLQSGRSFTEISGRWVLGSPGTVAELPGHSAGFCLLRFDSDTEHTVYSAELGYVAAAVSPETVRLTPMWRFVMDDGTVYLNAVTGEEYRGPITDFET